MGDVGDGGRSSGGPIQVRVFGRTDVGLVREHNEDNFLVSDLERGNRSLLPEVRDHEVGPRGTLLAVCDGMGGAAAGEVASQIAVDTVYELMSTDGPPDGVEGLAMRLEAAILAAGKRIFQSAKADRTRRGMGTTITAATLISDRVIFGQVGDSRAYLIRQGRITQVTRDQSLVNQLIEAGQLKPEEAELFEHSNIILQALGTAEEVTVDLTYVDLRRGDLVLMCSDGLSGLVSDERIRQLVMENMEPMQACKALTEAAREGGGHDNITVIMALFEGDGLEPPADDDAVEFRRLEIPGRTPLPTRQAAPSMPEWEAPVDQVDRESDPSLQPAPVERKPSRAGREGRKGDSNPLFMGIAVAAVLAIGVGLGFLIVSGTGNGDTDSAPDGPTVVEPAQQLVRCHFTSDTTGTRLVIDGTDYGEITTGGRWVELAPGTHSVEGRVGLTVVVQRQIVLNQGQAQAEFPLEAEVAPPVPDAGAGQVFVDAGAEETGDGGPKPPDTGLRDMPDGEDGGPAEVVPEAGPPVTPPEPRDLPRLPTNSVTRPHDRPRPRPEPPRPPRLPRPRPPPPAGGVDPNPYD